MSTPAPRQTGQRRNGRVDTLDLAVQIVSLLLQVVQDRLQIWHNAPDLCCGWEIVAAGQCFAESPRLMATVLLHLPIDRDGNEPAARLVQKLDNLMPFAGEFHSVA